MLKYITGLVKYFRSFFFLFATIFYYSDTVILETTRLRRLSTNQLGNIRETKVKAIKPHHHFQFSAVSRSNN